MNLMTRPLPPPAPCLSSLPMLIMTRFIGKEGLTARILTFTTKWSLRLTRHVEAFKMVESLVDYRPFDALGPRRNDDSQRAGFFFVQSSGSQIRRLVN